MEALAAWQIKKKRAAEATKAAEEEKLVEREYSKEDQIRINRIFGFPDPPEKVFCLGKDGCAAVWWVYEDLEGIVGWEVWRYRRDGDDSWQCKGCVSFETLSPLQVVINDLTNGFEYKFAVKAINGKGTGVESVLSNGVMVDSPLPPGWYRFYDRRRRRFYFASLKTGRSSWTRPDLDPDFIGDDIYSKFNKRELACLRGLFDEDIHHFGCIRADQLNEIIREIGERLTAKKIAHLFSMISGDATKLTTWQQFLQLIVAIKEQKTRPLVKYTPWRLLFHCITRTKIRHDLKSSRNKLGPWVIEYNAVLQKSFYRHSVTGATSWIMPDEVKFYLPKKLEQKFLRIFDFGQMEDFKQYFSLLDLDNSGDLSAKEISLLLDAMGIQIHDKVLEDLIESVDVNGNGTVEFDEFCWMMYELGKKDSAITSKQAKRNGGFGFLSSSLSMRGGSMDKTDGEGGGETSLKLPNSSLTFSQLQQTIAGIRRRNERQQPRLLPRISSVAGNSTAGSGGAAGGVGLRTPLFMSSAGSTSSATLQNNVVDATMQQTTGSVMSNPGTENSKVSFGRRLSMSLGMSSSKVLDEASAVSSLSGSKKPTKKKIPNPDLYKPKPKAASRRKSVVSGTGSNASSSPPKGKYPWDQSIEDDDDDEDYGDEDGDYDDGRSSGFGLRSSGSFFGGLSRANSSVRLDANGEPIHEKDCMCGCRRF